MSESRNPESPSPGLGSGREIGLESELEPELEPEPTPEELAAAEALREALEPWPRQALCERRCLPAAQADLDLARAVLNAARPEAIDPLRHERIVVRSIVASARAPSRPPRRLPAVFGAASALAMAAAAVLVLSQSRTPPSSATSESPLAATDPVTGARAKGADSPLLVPCRSAAQLFDTQFPVSGGTTDRVDRIVLARQRDLRTNLFAQWRAP